MCIALIKNCIEKQVWLEIAESNQRKTFHHTPCSKMAANFLFFYMPVII